MIEALTRVTSTYDLNHDIKLTSCLFKRTIWSGHLSSHLVNCLPGPHFPRQVFAVLPTRPAGTIFPLFAHPGRKVHTDEYPSTADSYF